SAKPCSLARFFQINQTILAFTSTNFFRNPQLSSQATEAVRFSEAFDYAPFFKNRSTFEDFFFTTTTRTPKRPAASTTKRLSVAKPTSI
ncbi:hypothetical protein QMO14_14325, partial [Variovorax sp. CAN2819]|uniref:hypothetical protein n=1 Tax=Variovorax sp. CAN15 TaxID=3046727 RepID=UPI00264A215D